MSSSSVDLNLLAVLHAVLVEGSVAKAGRRLHVTPSAVSNSLARLRALIGDPLVTKKGRGIVPTPRALELAPVLAASLEELNRAIRTRQFNPLTTTRCFSVALSDAAQVALLPSIATLLVDEMPRATLRVLGIDSFMSQGGLAGQEVDVVIGPDAPGPDVHAAELFAQPAVLICRERHPALLSQRRAKASVALRHVAVEMASGQALRNLAGSAYAAAGATRDVAVTVPTFAAAAAIVAATDLVATVPESVYLALRRTLRLRTLPLPIPRLTVPTNMYWHARTHGDAAAAAFRDIIRRAAARRAPIARRDESPGHR